MKKEGFKKIVTRSGYYGTSKIHRGYGEIRRIKRYAQQKGISEASREFGTTRKTVRLWFHRYLKDGVRGLLDRSHTPHHIPHKTSKELEQRVVELKRRYFTFSASRSKELFDLPLSCGVDLKRITIQTDNGEEFVGSSKKKEPSEFVRLVEQNWGGHFPIPPGAKTYNSDVEAFHRRIEDEFYRVEPINSYKDKGGQIFA